MKSRKLVFDGYTCIKCDMPLYHNDPIEYKKQKGICASCNLYDAMLSTGFHSKEE
jgi:hypothetical protein